MLWDPTGLSKERLVLPLNYFFIVQHSTGSIASRTSGDLFEALRRIPHAE